MTRVDETRFIPGGTFAMGSDRFYAEERPVHRVTVDALWRRLSASTGIS